VDDQDKPRPKATTLAGVGPSSAPPVVGAVARPSSLPPSDVTRRMIFEPPADADPLAGSRSVSPEEAAIDNQWPDEPPTAAPVQLATVPPARRVPAATRVKVSMGVEGARRRKWWVALAALALGAGAAGLRASRSRSHSVATPNQPMVPTATAIDSATATAFAPPLASSGPPVAETPPQLSLGSPAPAFDATAAKDALDATASAVARCQRGQVSGPGYAIVTFANDGAVRRSAVSPPFLGTSAGMCVARALAQARAPAFVGKPGVVVHHFVVPAQGPRATPPGEQL
jgi:hypothetical protein